LILATVLDYVWGANSSAMAFTRRVVSESESVRSQVGVVEHVELRRFWGFRRKSGFAGARVDLYLRVSGTEASLPMEVRLEQRGDTWHVVRSSVPL
jgi:hypothetical protein